MTERPKAIDIMYYVATPEFIAKWTDAKKGELVCRMERAIDGAGRRVERVMRIIGDSSPAGRD